MTLMRWNPFGESMNRFDPYRSVGDLRAEVNRMLGNVFGPVGGGSQAAATWVPAVDMFATKEDLIVTVELPGVVDKEVDVSVTGDVLSIRGQRGQADDAKAAQQYWGERWFGKFERHLALPFPVNTSAVKAAFKDGVLTVTLPKADEVKPRHIKIEAF
jgi:HSP20 family protein